MYVERVAMVIKNTGSAYLPLFCSLFLFFSHRYFTSFQRKVHFNLTVWVRRASLWDFRRPQLSNKQHNKRFTALLSEEIHRRLWQHVVLHQCDFFTPPWRNSIIGGKRTRVSLEKIITSWQKRLLCFEAERDSCAFGTQMPLFSLPPTVRPCASALIALIWPLWVLWWCRTSLRIPGTSERSQIVWQASSFWWPQLNPPL